MRSRISSGAVPDRPGQHQPPGRGRAPRTPPPAARCFCASGSRRHSAPPSRARPPADTPAAAVRGGPRGPAPASTPSSSTTCRFVNSETAMMASARAAASRACAVKRARNSGVEYSPVITNRSWKVATARPRQHARQPLVQPVEQSSRRGPAAPAAGAAAHSAASSPARAQKAVRPVAEIEARLGMRRRQPEQNLARVESDSRERVADAVSRVECDRREIAVSESHDYSQSLYSFILRYSVVRLIFSSWPPWPARRWWPPAPPRSPAAPSPGSRSTAARGPAA